MSKLLEALPTTDANWSAAFWLFQPRARFGGAVQQTFSMRFVDRFCVPANSQLRLLAAPSVGRNAGARALFGRQTLKRTRSPLSAVALGSILATVSVVHAGQIDIVGPAGSVAFGTSVAVLPNGNIVVVDPYFSQVGAVYLYSPTGTLISTLTGSTNGDQVGIGGIGLVGNGNFVVKSQNWHNGAATLAGAATWVNGTTGLSGVVSVSNSLVGTTTYDQVGYIVTALSNGNYVVLSSTWNGVGAATWPMVRLACRARFRRAIHWSVRPRLTLLGTLASPP